MTASISIRVRPSDGSKEQQEAWQRRIRVALGEMRQSVTHVRHSWFVDGPVFIWDLCSDQLEQGFLSRRVNWALVTSDASFNNLGTIVIERYEGDGRARRSVDRFEFEPTISGPSVMISVAVFEQKAKERLLRSSAA